MQFFVLLFKTNPVGKVIKVESWAFKQPTVEFGGKIEDFCTPSPQLGAWVDVVNEWIEDAYL